ncbi:P-loop containing nucleoside triphosphate hydrolase protein [Lactarius sanguifluus]|nr:P-loop containing nucleoside triphosphate hydrolase protein [Lactarius sanguifluus]
MLTERIMHECIKKLLGNVENPEEEEIESLCKLLTTVGSLLDTPKARAHLDVYFSRMRGLMENKNVDARTVFVLQDVIELRERKWIPRNAIAAPTMIAQVHEPAAQEKIAVMRQNVDSNDLDSIDVSALAALGSGDAPVGMNAVQALKYIDDKWYKKITGKKARWMDLIGDYAGNERFILDGESLLQQVLDDPLLALARPGDPSFQTLHAINSLERLLNDMLKRSAVFDIVFWEDTRHLTLKGDTDLLVSSRSLARALLFSHLAEHASGMGLDIYAFSSLADPAWIVYQQRTKPMFVMLNDGGTPAEDDHDMATHVLIQRNFVFCLLTSGIAVTLLHGAEFRDSKIFSFVFEGRFGLETRKSFLPALWSAVQVGATKLDEKWKHQFPRVPLAPLRVSPPGSNDLDIFLKNVLDHLVLHTYERTHLFWELTSLFFLHIMVLQTLPVSERARQLETINDDIETVLIQTFLPDLYSVIAAFVLKSNHFVDIDGRIFVAILHCATSGDHLPTHALEALVGPEISSRLETVWKSTNAPPPDLPRLLAYRPTHENSESESSSAASDEEDTSFTLLPFHNEVFNDELAAVHVTVADQGQALSSPRLEFSQDIPFSDTRHWHANHRTILPKHQGGEAANIGERARRKQLRRDQRFMSQMQRLATTLTGASGKALQQILIPPTGRKVSEIVDDPSLGGPKRGKKEDKKGLATHQIKGKSNALSARDRIRQEHARDKKVKEDSSSQEWWVEQLRQVERMASRDLKLSALHGLLRNPRTDTGWLNVEVRLYNLHLTIQQWIAETEPDAPAVHDRYTVSVMRTVKELYTHDFLTETTLGVLASIMAALGFTDYISPLEDDASHRLQPDRDLAFSFVKLLKSKSHKPVYKFMAIKEDPVIWQLRVFGEYMDRSMDSAPDPRVGFQPDAWQREVLDCLDQPKRSLLVVAPTSAGKTFISFYAMEKILRESDDGIIVYVAPTKALVNQVAAEVYARFRKEVDGRTCWAIHTRDYRVHDSQKCQILVTVPEMLGIMLLSPPLARTWTPRIRRIILDEIHTIGQQEGGTVWEQIILLAPCPIIGLSATIGEPEKFNAWLESVQRSKGFVHKFIHHPHRYSHLRKFAYFPQLLRRDEPFLGLDGGSPPTEMMRFVHPVSTLSFGGTMPPDLSLEAPDLLRLHEVLKGSQGDAYAERLDPTAFFSGNKFIRQKDVLGYETEIKNILARLVVEPDSLDPSSPLQRVVRHIQDPVIMQTSNARLNTPPSHSGFMSGLIHLLSDLKAENSLPALLFNFDRHECQLMAEYVLDTLERAEEVWRDQSPEWKHKVSQWKAWQARQKEKQRAAQKASTRKKNQDDRDDGRQQSEELTWESYFDPQDPSPQFSFAGTSAYPKEELLEDVTSLSRWTSTPESLVRALRRGVAVHHSGLNKAYRVLVERLFRVGFLRVVIATGTLALGINAPTKASVFCGDSPFLTALTFRQCAGRAGRRGFDLLGRVIFYGIPLDRIYRILLSRLPRLTGTFPLSSTMVLRLFDLLEGSNYAPYAVDAIRSILRLPHISFGSDVGKSQLLHHLRFSIDYLRRANLLDQAGKPINLFGIAAHLYYTEPGNLATTALLQSGVIHNICSQPDTIQAERDLVLLLCHIFGRKYLPQVYASASNVRDLIQKGPSRVVLPPLHPEARAFLIRHQKETLGIFSAYAQAFSSQHANELGPDDRLPLSGITFGPSDMSTCPQTALFSHLSQTAVRPNVRSLFVATSGHGDAFGGVGELVRTVRRGVHLNEHSIPTVEKILDPELPLNAYLYDFFVHGQVDALVNMNGIRRGDVWYDLEAFQLVLVTIRGDLENLLLKTSRDSAVRAAERDDDTVDAGDSGYHSLDPTGRGEEEEAGGSDGEGGEADRDPAAFTRPRGVPDRDWRVYEIVNKITNEFDVKFKAMWA